MSWGQFVRLNMVLHHGCVIKVTEWKTKQDQKTFIYEFLASIINQLVAVKAPCYEREDQ